MELKKIKEDIKLHKLNESIIIFKCDDTKFIANQYIDEISRYKNLIKTYVDNISKCENYNNNFFDEPVKDKLFIINTNVFKSDVNNLSGYDNIIIVCNKLDDSTKSLFDRYIVEVPKIESWQILEYMKVKCKGIKEDDLIWLRDISNNDIYRIENEINKINIFNTDFQEDIFKSMKQESMYSDLSLYNIYNITNCILKKDTNKLKTILKEINSIDVEGIGLLTILHNNFKNIISIQLNRNASPESLNMNSKQFNAIRYSCGILNNSELIKIFKFLTDLDYKIKSGSIQLSNDRLIDYIICKVVR